MPTGDYMEGWHQEQANKIALDNDRPIGEIVQRITNLLIYIDGFWSNCRGWAPEDAAEMLEKSRLDRMVSLAYSMHRWVEIPPTEISDGDLILAWTNLGSLLEGTLKLFLCIYLDHLRDDLENASKTRIYHQKKEIIQDPDGLTLDPIISYLDKAEILPKDFIDLSRNIQEKRNGIHFFEDRNIEDGFKFREATIQYRQLLKFIHARLPYPDGYLEPNDI
jgi:hypothetical protein